MHIVDRGLHDDVWMFLQCMQHSEESHSNLVVCAELRQWHSLVCLERSSSTSQFYIITMLVTTSYNTC